MVVNKGTEQGIVALPMLACQKDHTPVTAEQIAVIMGVSVSYPKKTTRKLVVAGLAVSIRSRDGGFVLARTIEKITLGDAFHAVEGDQVGFAGPALAGAVFAGCEGLPLGMETMRAIL